MNKQTDFQKEFKVDDEFYTGEQIRNAIKKHFPLDKEMGYIGIQCITNIKSFHPSNENDLEKLIPNGLGKNEEYNEKYHNSYIYGITEVRTKEGTPVTKFFQTDLGYICDEQTLYG